MKICQIYYVFYTKKNYLNWINAKKVKLFGLATSDICLRMLLVVFTLLLKFESHNHNIKLNDYIIDFSIIFFCVLNIKIQR